MSLTIALLWSSVTFAQDDAAPPPPAVEAPAVEAPAVEAPAVEAPIAPQSEVNPAAQGQLDAAAADLGLAPGLIGAAAGFCPSGLCVCLGAGACVGVATYFYKSDAPIPADAVMQPGPYLEAYNKELQKRRAVQALVGGSIGVVVGLGANVALAYGLGYL